MTQLIVDKKIEQERLYTEREVNIRENDGKFFFNTKTGNIHTVIYLSSLSHCVIAKLGSTGPQYYSDNVLKVFRPINKLRLTIEE
jgi:hypothetical protein